MGISGSLKDVSVADVMQFIHLGRRTGTLLLQRGAQRAMIGFHVGRLVSAQAPGTPKLGDLLVSSGLLARETLDDAIFRQGREPERRSLGKVLVGAGHLSEDDLRRVIAQQIEQAVSEIMIWDNGTFEFAIDDLRPIDDVALYPSDFLPDADINIQMVLLEAARIFDERNRGGHEADGDSTSPGLGPATAAAAADRPQLEAPAEARPRRIRREGTPPVARLHAQIVTPDLEFASRAGVALSELVAGVERVPLDQAGQAAPGEPPPVVLLDLRRGGVDLAEAAALRRSWPLASVIALVDSETSFARIYEAGVLSAVPLDLDAVVACVENVISSRGDLGRSRAAAPVPPPVRAQSGVARLRRVFGDLRSGLISATVALNLMHIISESVERAVLFLVKRDHLVALGAFGVDGEGRSLAELTRGLRLRAGNGTVLERSLANGEVQSLQFEQTDLPEPFASIIGRSRTGQVVIFPVLGSQRVISVIYADNGDRDEPIEDIDILELATAQVGMAFENELLRRQITQGNESS